MVGSFDDFCVHASGGHAASVRVGEKADVFATASSFSEADFADSLEGQRN